MVVIIKPILIGGKKSQSELSELFHNSIKCQACRFDREPGAGASSHGDCVLTTEAPISFPHITTIPHGQPSASSAYYEKSDCFDGQPTKNKLAHWFLQLIS